MPRNGAGIFTLATPPAPFVNGQTASATDVMTVLTDLAAAMTGSVAADGQTPLSGALNANSQNITNVNLLSAASVVMAAGSSSGGFTVGDGLVVTKGGATVTAGGLTVSAGGATITGDSAVTGALTTSTPGTSGNQVVNFSQFPLVVGGIGSFTLPNTLIIKWGFGVCVAGVGAVDYTTVGLLDFPSATLWAACAINTSGAPHTDSPPGADPASYTAAGFNVYCGTGAGTGYSWLAIGN